MKIHPSSRPASRERGSITLILFVLLSIMAILIMANLRSLATLQRTIRLTEQQQIHRLAGQSAAQPNPETK